MKYSVKDVRRDYRIWMQREQMLDDACCRSNLGYRGSTVEAALMDGTAGAGVPGGGSGRSRVPAQELDELGRLEQQIEDICYVMRRMPDEFVEVLQADYAGEVAPHGEARRHRDMMTRIVMYWNGVVVGMSRAA